MFPFLIYLPPLLVGVSDLLIWTSDFFKKYIFIYIFILRWRITKCWHLMPLSDKSSI